MLLLIIATSLLVGGTQAQSSKDIFNIILDTVKSSPQDNVFLKMAESGQVESFIAAHVKSFAVRYGAPDACTNFQANDGNFAVDPIGRRDIPPAAADVKLSGDLLSILSSAEGMNTVKDVSGGKNVALVAPKFASGVTASGAITVNALSGSSQGGSSTNYLTHNLSLTKTGQRSTFGVLSQRIRNIITKPHVLHLFREATLDRTVRIALYNLFNCNPLAKFVQFYYDIGV